MPKWIAEVEKLVDVLCETIQMGGKCCELLEA